MLVGSRDAPTRYQRHFWRRYAVVWTAFALVAFVGDTQIHWLSNAKPAQLGIVLLPLLVVSEACGKIMKEAKDVLSCSNSGGCCTYLAVEIDDSQFAGYPVSIPAALSYPSVRSAAGLFLLLTGGTGGAART